MKTLLTVLTSGILVLYPFAVYLGLNYFSASQIACILLVLLSARILLMKNALGKMPWLLPASVLGGGAILISVFTDSPLGVSLYPVMVNATMLAVFGYSFVKPPTVIEAFARLKEPDLTLAGVNYTAKVTLLWCGFFLVNGSIALYTALYTSFETWTLYNGLIAYLLMAGLMAGEYLVRLQVKQHHQVPQSPAFARQEQVSSNQLNPVQASHNQVNKEDALDE